jgi:hypothetical protein
VLFDLEETQVLDELQRLLVNTATVELAVGDG